MKRLVVLWLALGLVAAACRKSTTDQRPDSPPPQASAPQEAADLGDLVIAAPVSYQNLAIFPVLSKTPKNEDRYITLEEGLKAGTVEIYEVGADGVRIDPDEESRSQPEAENAAGQEDIRELVLAPDEAEPTEEDPLGDELPVPAQQDGQVVLPDGVVEEINELLDEEVDGEVNRLMVLNTSGRPLYLMPGEVICGGKQDRTIAEETIILASKEPQPIDVYCVEHGRWGGRAEEETMAATLSFVEATASGVGATVAVELDEDTLKELAAEANRGKFVASAGNLSKASRMAVQAAKDQQEVWNAVGEANAQADFAPLTDCITATITPTGTFTANYTSEEAVERLKPYIEKLQAPVAEQKQVVGAIVAVNGKVESVDVFGSTPLFRKLWPKLLKSHALDAANAADAPEAQKVCTLEAAREFLSTAMQADVGEKATEGGLVVTRRESQGVVSFAAAAEDAEGGMGMGGFAGSVHSAAYAK